eukprot:5623375-Prymnesium_polylepis.1
MAPHESAHECRWLMRSSAPRHRSRGAALMLSVKLGGAAIEAAESGASSSRVVRSIKKDMRGVNAAAK